ncbi:MAG: TetR/AcrR family transcriptional regulator [Clostridiales bacterium]|nr:TetR/AcrR family transcriptional regulator [Clostridiales bacterium]
MNEHVHICNGDNHLRKKDTELRERLIKCAIRIEYSDGVDAINIRRLAAEANIAVGTVYNYFDCKQDVLLALTEDFWTTALEEMKNNITEERFSIQIARILTYLHSKMDDRAVRLMKSLHNDVAAGRVRMMSTLRVLHQTLVERLKQDRNIRQNVWDEAFTMESFAEFVLMHLVLLLQQNETNANTFIQIIERVLY